MYALSRRSFLYGLVECRINTTVIFLVGICDGGGGGCMPREYTNGSKFEEQRGDGTTKCCVRFGEEVSQSRIEEEIYAESDRRSLR